MLRSLPTPKETVSKADTEIPGVLPQEKMYSIQIGTRLFHLSGASLSYDSPSYFTNYFQCSDNEDKVLFIDRSPQVFEKICMHLQGYSISVHDEYEFLYLFADATYFHLEKLRKRLLDEGLFVNVGGRSFRIPKRLFLDNGNYPNYFSVMYDTMVRDPFLSSDAMLRPPPMEPFTVKRNAVLFEELLQVLHGTHLEIAGEQHRRDLITEAKYYRFFAAEQELLKVDVRTNPYSLAEEILIGYEDIRKEGLLNPATNSKTPVLVKYTRPFVDKCAPRDLVIQIDSEEVALLINVDDPFTSLSVRGQTAQRLHDMFSVVTEGLIFEIDADNVPKLTMFLAMDKSVARINGVEMKDGWIDSLISAKRSDPDDKKMDVDGPRVPPKVISVKLSRSQWKVWVAGTGKIWFGCVMLEGTTDESYYYKRRGFL